MDKKIFVGDIEEETYYGTPIELFKKAIEISKEECFIIETNNPQFVEALEVLCGEENIDFYICTDGHSCKVDRAMEVYNYLGDVYDIINSLRFRLDIAGEFDDDELDFTDWIQNEIEEYELKHQYLSEEDFAVDERKFRRYEQILPKPKQIEAYKLEKPTVIRNPFGKKVIGNKGDWVVKYDDGNLSIITYDLLIKYKEV